mgnify:CR=1 FL=1
MITCDNNNYTRWFKGVAHIREGLPADPIAKQLPKTRFSGMGRISALAADAGLKGAEVYDHWSASQKGIEDKVENAAVFKAKTKEVE